MTKHGAPEVLQSREVADPVPHAGEVRIAVRAAGVNFADIMARLGLYPDAPAPPLVVGYEVAGVIDAVGPGVTTLRVGDRVLALTRFGGYASAAVTSRPSLRTACRGVATGRSVQSLCGGNGGAARILLVE